MPRPIHQWQPRWFGIVFHRFERIPNGPLVFQIIVRFGRRKELVIHDA